MHEIERNRSQKLGCQANGGAHAGRAPPRSANDWVTAKQARCLVSQFTKTPALADLGGRARRAPPHLPGILVFDDILGHIV